MIHGMMPIKPESRFLDRINKIGKLRAEGFHFALV
jgi:hypothetical protein